MQPYQEKKGINLTLILVPTIIILLAAAIVSAILLGWFSGSNETENRNGEPADITTDNNGYPNGENGYYPNGYENGHDSSEPETPEPTAEPASPLTYRERYDRIVWINAGGGGSDVGSEGVFNGATIWGKDITLAIALKVYELFEYSESGVKAFLLRSSDVTFSAADRPHMWNETADMIVSIHMNSFSHEDPDVVQTVAGFEVHYNQNHTIEETTGRFRLTGLQFAELMRNSLAQEIDARNRGINGTAGFIVNTTSTAPSIIINAGFMSNTEELTRLIDPEYQWSIAQGIYNAIVNAFRFPPIATE